LEERLFSSCNNDLLPKLYLRYIDDVSAVFDDDTSRTRFLDIFNSVQLNTAKNTREQGTTRDPIVIRVEVRAAYLCSVIVIMSLEAK